MQVPVSLGNSWRYGWPQMVQGSGSCGGCFPCWCHSLESFPAFRLFMTIIIFCREPFLGAAVCLAALGVLLIALQPGGDGCLQAWGWVHPALASSWWGSPLLGYLALPCPTLYLHYSQLCFLLPLHFVLFLEGFCLVEQMEGTLYAQAYAYVLNFYILFEHILNLNPLLPFWT